VAPKKVRQMEFIVKNIIEKKKEVKQFKPKVFLVEADGKQGYITEENFIIAQRQGKNIRKIRELNI